MTNKTQTISQFKLPRTQEQWASFLSRKNFADVNKTAKELESEWDLMVSVHEQSGWLRCKRCFGTDVACQGDNTCRRASQAKRGRAYESITEIEC